MANDFICSDAAPYKDDENDDSISKKNISSNTIEDVMAIMRMTDFCDQSYYNIYEPKRSNYDIRCFTYRNEDIEIMSSSESQGPSK